MPRSRTLLIRGALALGGLVAVAAGGGRWLGRSSLWSAVPVRWSALGPHTPLVAP